MKDRIWIVFFWVLLVIGFLTIVGTFFIFWLHSRISLWADIDKDTFGILGDFIGGIVGTLFSIAATILIWITYKSQKLELKETRNLLEKQIKISYKPEICIRDKYVRANVINFSNGDPVSFNIENSGTEENRQYDHFSLINIGVAPAKYVKYRWDFDTLECLNFLSEHEGNHTINLKLDNGGHSLNVYTNDEEFGHHFFITPLLAFQQFDVLLPYKELTDEKSLPLPFPYTLLLLLSFERMKNEAVVFDFPHQAFPPLRLHICYQDIESNNHIKIFNINIEVLSESTSRNALEHKNDFQLKVSGNEHR